MRAAVCKKIVHEVIRRGPPRQSTLLRRKLSLDVLVLHGQLSNGRAGAALSKLGGPHIPRRGVCRIILARNINIGREMSEEKITTAIRLMSRLMDPADVLPFAATPKTACASTNTGMRREKFFVERVIYFKRRSKPEASREPGCASRVFAEMTSRKARLDKFRR